MDQTKLKVGRWISIGLIAVILLLNAAYLFGIVRGPAIGPRLTSGGSTPTPAGGAEGNPTAPVPNNAKSNLPVPSQSSANNNSSATPSSPAAPSPKTNDQKTNDQKIGAANDQNKITDRYIPDPVGPGRTITLHGSFEGDDAWYVILTNVENTSVGIPAMPGEVASDKKSLSFSLSPTLPDGRYFAVVQLDARSGPKQYQVPGELRVPSPPALKVTVEKVQAKDAYPYPNTDDKYDFEISGTNFSRNLADNHVEINGVPLPLRCEGCADKNENDPVLLKDADNPTTKLIVHNYTPPGYANPLEVSLRVGSGDNVAKAPKPLMFSSVSRNRLQVYAVGSFVLLVAILFILVQTGARRRGDKFWSLSAFLIDQETKSYSLSKFQLMLFTLVTVFGYIYVFVCHLFVQWKFALPPVPEGLPTMLGLSVGTSVVAAGIGTRIGGKGAGPESPSMADFISSGGVVLPERFQFFLWTIVSSGGILALILASDPGTIIELPKLPDGMLYLMGLSSAGYLGGKLVRGPGPSVRSIDVKKGTVKSKQGGLVPALVVVLNGDNLSTEAIYQLDEEHIPSEQVHVAESTPEPGGNPKLCGMLKVELSMVANRYFDGPHTLTIINPDSQAAVVRFGATIESVTRGETEGTDVSFSVVGANFKDPSSATWIGAGDSVRSLGPAAITKKSELELEVKVPVATVGPDRPDPEGKLCIVSPGGLTTTFDLETKTQVATPAAALDAKPPVEGEAADVARKQAVGDQTSTESGTENNDNVEGTEKEVDDEEKPKDS